MASWAQVHSYAGAFSSEVEGDREVTFRVMLLWGCLLFTMITESFVVSWLPTLLGDVVAAADQALWLSSLFPLGGIAAMFVIGSAGDRLGPWRVLIGLFGFAIPLVAMMGLTGHATGLLTAAIVLAGFCVIGAHHLLTALAATLYPTVIRGTGTSWAVATGRVGSILGPLAAGVLIGWRWPLSQLFPTMAIFVAVAGLLAWVLVKQDRTSVSA